MQFQWRIGLIFIRTAPSSMTFSSMSGLILTTFRFMLFNFPTKGLRSNRRSSPCIFHVAASLSIRRFLIIGATYTGTDRSILNLRREGLVQILIRMFLCCSWNQYHFCWKGLILNLRREGLVQILIRMFLCCSWNQYHFCWKGLWSNVLNCVAHACKASHK